MAGEGAERLSVGDSMIWGSTEVGPDGFRGEVDRVVSGKLEFRLSILKYYLESGLPSS